MPIDFTPVVGHRFQFRSKPIRETNFSGAVDGEALDVEPEKLLRLCWRDANPASDFDSTVCADSRPPLTPPARADQQTEFLCFVGRRPWPSAQRRFRRQRARRDSNP